PCTSYLLLTASLLLILLNCSSSPSPPPPSSTLFPYTTLFRSPEYVTERVLGGAIDHQPHGPIAVMLADQYQRTGEVRISQRRQGDQQLAGKRGGFGGHGPILAASSPGHCIMPLPRHGDGPPCTAIPNCRTVPACSSSWSPCCRAG